MSYILDALKKAEAERKLGTIPNLHAQQASTLAHTGGNPFFRKASFWVLSIALILAAGAAWFNLRQTPSVPGTTTELHVPPAPPPAAEATDAAAVTLPVRAASSPVPSPIAMPAQALTRPTAVKPVKTRHEQPDVVNATPVPAPTSARQETIANVRELPEKIRSELPPLSIGGYLYSENQAESQLLVNKKLLHEGDEAAPGVTLEKMTAKAAVFNYKGYRYQVAY